MRDDGAPGLRKDREGVTLDLSGIAKGYAIDRVSALLDGRGWRDYLIEFGGELKGRGENAAGEGWVVGIESPEPGRREIGLRVMLENEAMATSGNYRLYRKTDGGRIASHLVDPMTGNNEQETFRAVTVIGLEAAAADAWATALFAMGDEEGVAFAEAAGMAVCFQKFDEDRGDLSVRMTGDFSERLVWSGKDESRPR
jgi:thiamine biosynthesis lipoprotein